MVSKNVKEISKEKVFDGFFKVEEVELECEAGKFKRLNINAGDSVAVLLSTPKDRFVLLKQYRYATSKKSGNGWIWEIPAGKIDFGETQEQAAVREVKEETGYIIDASKLKIYNNFYPAVGSSDEVVYIYYYELTNEKKEERVKDFENNLCEVIELNIISAIELLGEGKIIDAKTIIAFQEFILRNINAQK